MTKVTAITVGIVVLIALTGALLWNPKTEQAKPKESLPPQAGLPADVESTRQIIYKAAKERDYETLRGLIKPGAFSYSFGGEVDGNAIEYWKKKEANGNKLLEKMPLLLTLPYAKQFDICVWPGVFIRSADEWTKEDLVTLGQIATEQEIEDFRKFGGYIGYRIGIRSDGTWAYFIAGD